MDKHIVYRSQGEALVDEWYFSGGYWYVIYGGLAFLVITAIVYGIKTYREGK